MLTKAEQLVVLMLLMTSACTGPMGGSGGTKDDAKHQLTEYISHSFSVKGPDDRQQLLSYLTGEAKTRLAAWSDEQFRQAFIENKRQFLNLLIREQKTVSPSEFEITYEISYLDRSKGDAKGETKITNKKLAQLHQEGGKWLISDVRNIKDLIEYRNEMSLP